MKQAKATDESQPTIDVLYVDDKQNLTDLVATFLEREQESFEVTTATSAHDGVAELADHQFDCIVSDYDMPQQDGLEFLRTVRESYPEIPFILYTGKGSEEIASHAISTGVDEYLQKQSDTDHYSVLANRIANLVEKHQSEQRLETVLNRMTDAFFSLDTDWQFSYLNDAALNLLDREREELLGARVWDEFPGMAERSYYDYYHDAMESQEPVTLVEQCPITAQPLKEHIYPSPTGLSVYFREVSEELDDD